MTLTYKVNGVLSKVVDPNNQKVYYHGILEGNTNSDNTNPLNFIVILNPENNKEEFYISAGYGIKEETGVLMFGNEIFHKEFRILQQELSNGSAFK